MNIRTIATVAVALMLGLVATLLVRSYVHHAPSTGKPILQAASQPVVVAARAIERGEPLSGAAVKVAFYPADAIPAGAYTSVGSLTTAAGVRRALLPLAANQPVLASEISGPRANGGLSVVLAPGMRAIGVRTSDVAGVGGFILPGDRVDVLVTRPTGGDAALNTVAQSLAENVRVLGVDQTADADKPAVSKSITIEVTPEQAQTIALAQAVGTVTLSLRNEEDDGRVAHSATSVADLGGGAHVKRVAAAPAARAERPTTSGAQVRVTRGVETQNYAVAIK